MPHGDAVVVDIVSDRTAHNKLNPIPRLQTHMSAEPNLRPGSGMPIPAKPTHPTNRSRKHMKNMISQELLEKYQQLSAQEKKYKCSARRCAIKSSKCLTTARVSKSDLWMLNFRRTAKRHCRRPRSLQPSARSSTSGCAHIAPTIKTNLRVQSKSHSHPHKAVKGKDTWLEVSYEDWP